MNLQQERDCEEKFYEKFKNIYLQDKTKENMDRLSHWIHRLNIIDQKILIENQYKLSKDVIDVEIQFHAMRRTGDSFKYDEKIKKFYENHTKKEEANLGGVGSSKRC